MSIADQNFHDDSYDFNPTEQVQRGPAPNVLLPGVYRVEAQLMPRMRDGEPVVSTDQHGNEWPVLVIPGIEVVEGDSGRFDVWQEIKTRPERFRETDPYTSQAAILLSAIDQSLLDGLTSFGEVAAKLEEIANGALLQFNVSTGLTATDTEWAKLQIKQRGLEKGTKDYYQVWRDAELKTKAFMVQKGNAKQGLPAKYATEIVSPLSGNRLRAKVRIARFLPSSVNVEFGVGKFPPRD